MPDKDFGRYRLPYRQLQLLVVLRQDPSLEKRTNRRNRRITIGRYPDRTVEQARMKAQKLLGQLALGQDPFTGAGANDTQVITLKAAFADFKAARKTLKVRTVYDYERALQRAFTDWLSLPLAGITKDMVAARHGRLGQNSGPAYANYAMRLLQAIYNFAMYQYEDPQGRPTIHINPAVRLTQTRGWYRIPRRQTVIRAHQLPAWLSAVDGSRSTKSSRSTRSILTRALRTSVSSEGT